MEERGTIEELMEKAEGLHYAADVERMWGGFIESLVSEVGGLIYTDFPDAALKEVAAKYSLDQKGKLDLLRRFKASIHFSRWVNDLGGNLEDLDGLEAEWSEKTLG